MPQQRPRLRKREIALAVALGGLAAGSAALILDKDEHSMPVAAPNRLTYPVTPFVEVSTVGPQDVVVTIGDTPSVHSEGPPEALAQLEAVIEDDRLVIRPKRPSFGDVTNRGFRPFDWANAAGVTFHVTMPRIEAISLVGSGDVQVEQVRGERFEASVRGSGDLSVDAIQVEEAEFTVAGSGDLVASGTARRARVSITGSGEVSAAGLTARTASVSIAGSGDAELAVEEAARVSAMGSGTVSIVGPARCTVSRTGSGAVDCEGGTE